MGDYPDYIHRHLPGQTTDVAPGYAIQFSEVITKNVPTDTGTTFTWTLPNDGFVYKIDAIYVTISTTDWIFSRVRLNTWWFAADVRQGSCYLPIWGNPSAMVCYDDVLEVTAWHYAGSTKEVRVIIVGSRFLPPQWPYKAPEARFSGTPLSIVYGASVAFSGESTQSPDTWDWDFGDNTVHSGEQNPTHTYVPRTGYQWLIRLYDVTLVASNDAGSDGLTKDDYVTVNAIEVDPNDHLALSPYACYFTNLSCNEVAYVYQDFGASYFDKLDILFNMQCTSAATGGVVATMCLTNAIGDCSGFGSNDIRIIFYEPGDGLRVWFQVGPLWYGDYCFVSLGTGYYCSLEREAGSATATLKLYTDAARTVLHDTLTLTLTDAAGKWRYMYATASYYGGYHAPMTGVVANIIIPE